MGPKRLVFRASPGTGKTTTLLRLVGELLEKGVPPEKIGFTTFTKAGADHARDEAVKKFGLDPKRFKHFRTLHSIAYQALSNPRITENEPDFFKELTKATGTPCTYYRKAQLDDGPCTFIGDYYLSLYNLSRNRMEDPRETLLKERRYKMVDFTAFERYIERYEQLKAFHKMQDYTGIIEQFISILDTLVDIDFLFTDEGQDLTKLQWAMIQKLEQTVQCSYVAGDDKQAIYEWAGASPETLVGMEGEETILDQSYRLKSNILQLSEKIAKRIKLKSPYALKALREGGQVTAIRDLRALDLSKGNWLLLGRLNLDLIPYQALCDRLGYKYTVAGDNYADIFHAVRVFESVREGQWITMGDWQKVLPYLVSGESIDRGYKKFTQEADQLMSVNGETLRERFGLKARGDWYSTFKLPTYARETVHRMVAREGATTLPRIDIRTIHQAKGLEADNVVLLPRLSPACRATLEGDNADSEHRVFYVACTRAKENFFHVQGDETFYKI